jgi:putative flippase GtrA
MVRSFLRNLHSGPIAPQLRKFVVVGAFTATLQMVFLWALVELAGIDYLLGAVVAIELTIVLSYVLNNAWTFRAIQNTGVAEYLHGLLKTNVVRGTAIPIQLAVLFALVEWAAVPYLLANAVAIGISGLYRFVLDLRWTWGD